MLTKYHRKITERALGERFEPAALAQVVAANLGQDRLAGQFGHDEYHFDNNAFEQARTYLQIQRDLIRQAMETGDTLAARSAFGRLTHTAQDFYAHSNYLDLWLARFDGQGHPTSELVDPLDPDLLHSPDLRSGKLYYPWEIMSFVPGIKRFVIPRMPADSHARMNIDSPERGFRFELAFAASVKRTLYEYEQTIAGWSDEWLHAFLTN
jgi:hypothetical protein